MIPYLVAQAAFAEDRTLPHGFTPHDAPLFQRAGRRDAKGSVKGDDCAAAVKAALVDLGRDGAVLSVDGDGSAVCKQRKAGDSVSASVVELSGWWAEPGTGAPVPAARQLAMAKLLLGLMPGGSPIRLDPADGGGSWFAWPVVAPGSLPLLATPEERGAHAFSEWVSEWIPKWSAIAGALPEIAGGRIEVAWPADKASRGTLRFDVPKDVAARWYGGDIGDDVLVQGMNVGWSTDPRKVPFAKLQLDVEASDPRPRGELQQRDLDVRAEDMEGLEDEEQK